MHQRSPFIVAVANRKGGTGKTTTAVNLAAEWGRNGFRTLLIDLDTQGHCSLGLGYRQALAEKQCVHALFTDDDVSLCEVVHETEVDNVSLAPADTGFVASGLDYYRLKNAIAEESACRFDRIVVDTPPTLDGLLYNGLVAAHAVLVPFIPHHLAEVGVKQLAKLYYQVATRFNPDLSFFALLPIMFDRKIKLHQRVIEALRRQFGEPRILRAIRTNIKLAEAFEAGKPVRDFQARCAGSMDYHLLAQELELLYGLENSREITRM